MQVPKAAGCTATVRILAGERNFRPSARSTGLLSACTTGLQGSMHTKGCVPMWDAGWLRHANAAAPPLSMSPRVQSRVNQDRRDLRTGVPS